MAKKQTFGSKTEKGLSAKKNIIKLVKADKSSSGFLRFKEEILAVSSDKNTDSVVKELFSK